VDNDSVGAGGGGRFENESSFSVKLGDPAVSNNKLCDGVS
jgi:hypothetical protein